MSPTAESTPPDLVCYSAVHVHFYHISIVCSCYIYVCNHINLDISLQTSFRKRGQEFETLENDSKKEKLDLSGTAEGESINVDAFLSKTPSVDYKKALTTNGNYVTHAILIYNF